MLVIGCYRTEEAETSPLLSALLPLRESDRRRRCDGCDIAVGELAAEEAQRAGHASLLGGPHDAGRAEAIARESRGNPFLIDALSRFAQRASSSGARARRGDPATRVAELPRAGAPPARRRRRRRRAPSSSAWPSAPPTWSTKATRALAVLRSAHLVRTRRSTGWRRGGDVPRPRCARRWSRGSRRTSSGVPPAAGPCPPGVRPRRPRAAGRALPRGGRSAAGGRIRSRGRRRRRRQRARLRPRGRGSTASPWTCGPAPRAKQRLARPSSGTPSPTRAAARRRRRPTSQRPPAPAPPEHVDLTRRAAHQLLITGHVEEGLRLVKEVLASVGHLDAAQRPARPSSRCSCAGALPPPARPRASGERDAAQIPAQDLLRIDTCWSVAVGLGLPGHGPRRGLPGPQPPARPARGRALPRRAGPGHGGHLRRAGRNAHAGARRASARRRERAGHGARRRTCPGPGRHVGRDRGLGPGPLEGCPPAVRRGGRGPARAVRRSELGDRQRGDVRAGFPVHAGRDRGAVPAPAPSRRARRGPGQRAHGDSLPRRLLLARGLARGGRPGHGAP